MMTKIQTTPKTLFVVCPKDKIDNGDALSLGRKILASIYAGNSVEVQLGDNKIHGLDIRNLIIDDVAG